jgi:hypothetical protein
MNSNQTRIRTVGVAPSAAIDDLFHVLVVAAVLLVADLEQIQKPFLSYKSFFRLNLNHPIV